MSDEYYSKDFTLPPQKQEKQPGLETKLVPPPESVNPNYKAANKLQDKVAIITGGDSGIGRAVAYLFALEGAKVFITYLDEHEDAAQTKKQIEEWGGSCELLAGEIADEKFCTQVVDACVQKFGKIDILVNNAAVHFPTDDIEKISAQQLENTFKINIFSYFYMAKAVIKHFKNEGNIINTTSVTAYKGSLHLLDYAATKGAIVTFTRSLALNLVDKNIRVNGVAPGPIWTPLIAASFEEQEVAEFGKEVPMQRPGQPAEVAPSYVFLASSDSSYMTGQILHPNGGVIVNG